MLRLTFIYIIHIWIIFKKISKKFSNSISHWTYLKLLLICENFRIIIRKSIHKNSNWQLNYKEISASTTTFQHPRRRLKKKSVNECTPHKSNPHRLTNPPERPESTAAEDGRAGAASVCTGSSRELAATALLLLSEISSWCYPRQGDVECRLFSWVVCRTMDCACV